MIELTNGEITLRPLTGADAKQWRRQLRQHVLVTAQLPFSLSDLGDHARRVG